MKTIKYFAFIVTLILILYKFPSIIGAVTPTPAVNLFQLTSNSNRDDWPVIYKDQVYWIDARGGIYGYNFTTDSEFPFYTGTLPFTNLYGLVGFNGRYLVYTSYDGSTYNVRLFDTFNNIDLAVSNSINSRYATDIDGNTVVYIEGGGYGDLYVYDINRKTSTFVASNAAVPRISGNIVVWYINTGSGLYDIKAYDLIKNAYIDIPNPSNSSRQSPDVEGNKIIYNSISGSNNSIKIFDITKKVETTLANTNIYTYSWPAISKKYAVWGKSTLPNVAGVEGAELQTGQIFEIQPQGSFQNSNLTPYVDGNITTWFDWRTGNGDIYAAQLIR